MALNQTIFSPLTNYQGTITSYTYPYGNTLQILSSSLPAYQATGWQQKILYFPFFVNVTTQTIVSDIQLDLATNTKYIVNGYLLGSSAAAANGLRVGITGSLNLRTHYSIEVPSTTTAITYGNNAIANAGSMGASNVNNYYLVQLKAILITSSSGAQFFAPTISSENAGGGSTDVYLGPSIMYYRAF